jgi:hypothetical protein
LCNSDMLSYKQNFKKCQCSLAVWILTQKEFSQGLGGVQISH